MLARWKTNAARARRWKGRTAEELRRTAYHKAGHAVAHRVVGMVCGEATIVPDYDEMTGGYAIAQDHWAADYEWERRLKFRHGRSVMRGRIIGSMAGREAEIIEFGNHHGGDGDDLKQIGLMADAIIKRVTPLSERQVAERIQVARDRTHHEIIAALVAQAKVSED